MSTKQIKWLILSIPTLTIGIWEYLRHTILLPHVSMELGNWLSPIIIFLITIAFLNPLFQAYEHLSKQLKQERESTQLMAERERIARELHDGIAQTLFLSSVQVEKLKAIAPHEQWRELQHSLHHIQEYVRRSIHTLKTETQLALSAQLQTSIEQFRLDTGIDVHYIAQFQDNHFSQKEGWEIIAIINEALTNIRKHAFATAVWIELTSTCDSWNLKIEDNGVGFEEHKLPSANNFGLRIMKERAEECSAEFSFSRQKNKTIVHVRKKEL
ncbi:histidine kinase [Shimazuella sp. AN120528]|uniref:sensor histidine kinase n=1 Tax=Shimazuella soli TaxID=1892854 RepID=UPI001F0F2165|nr:histidine kinase [Shimazuella soli]MCH5585894.1 histidine kinase [Shimazuella soli]